MLSSLAAWSALSLLAQGQTSATGTPPVSPNDPGILDPVIAELLHDAYRVPGSLQVTGDSELVNLVGKVRRKKAKGARSATGAIIQDERPVTKNVDRALELHVDKFTPQFNVGLDSSHGHALDDLSPVRSVMPLDEGCNGPQVD